MRFLIVDDSSTMGRMIINASIAEHPGCSRSHGRSTRRGIRPQSTVEGPPVFSHDRGLRTEDRGPATLDPCNCGPPASVWIATRFMTRSSALSARPSHSRSSPAGYLFPIGPIDHRYAHEPRNRRALKRSVPIVKCFTPTRRAENGERSAVAPWALPFLESLDGSGGRTIGRAPAARRPPTTRPRISAGRDAEGDVDHLAGQR